MNGGVIHEHGMSLPPTGFTLHVGIVKSLLLTLLRQHGAAEVLNGWTGTDEEAEAAITADPREVFVLSGDCDNVGPDGACLGHPSRVAK